MLTLVDQFTIENEKIEIWQMGPNDFAVHYRTSQASYRGTLMEVMKDLNECFGVFD